MTIRRRMSRRIRGKNPEFDGLPDTINITKDEPLSTDPFLARYKPHPLKWEEDEISTSSDDSLEDSIHIPLSTDIPTLRQSRRFSWSFNHCISCLIVCVISNLLLLVLIPYFINLLDANSSQEMRSLQDMFPAQNSSLWTFIEFGKISDLPFVLLLVHDGYDNTTTCLAMCIARTLVKARFDSSVRPVVIDGAHSNFSGEFLEDLKCKMYDSRALVLLHVNDLDAQTAEKLHYVVDIHSPWIPKAIYVLTMEVGKLNFEHQIFQVVSKSLSEKWSDLITADQLGPLITRIANSISIVDYHVNPCPAGCES